MMEIIYNGGDPLKDCPTDYRIADRWAREVNGDRSRNYEPTWSWDCGFKLDFDGPLLSISSRFYPPKTHYGDKWDGTVSVVYGGDTIQEKQFECETLEELRLQVEDFVDKLQERISEGIIPLIDPNHTTLK